MERLNKARRGRPPTALKRLFRLKYLEGISDTNVLAEKLGVSTSTIWCYNHRLKRILLKSPGQNSPTIDIICPECLQPSFIYDVEAGEKVCTSCGYVATHEQQFDQSLPFDTTYALESDLAYGRSLGTSLSKMQLYRVLAKSRNGAADLGIRASQVRVIAETVEHPTLLQILNTCYSLSKTWRLQKDVLFNDTLGRNARRAFWLTRELALSIKPKTISETTFWLTLNQFAKEDIAKEAAKKLRVDKRLMNQVIRLNHLIKEAEKERIRYLGTYKLAVKQT